MSKSCRCPGGDCDAWHTNMRIYYAHCIALYGTPQEVRDLELLGRIFTAMDRPFEIVNPNSFNIERLCKDIKNKSPEKDVGQEIMDYVFRPLVKSCHVTAFRALPDGRIPAGVLQEVEWAREVGQPVIELPSGISSRAMTVQETREYLREVGNR
jgi:hypothetical protein